MDAYQKALKGSFTPATTPPFRHVDASHGSLRWLCQRYYTSAEFRQLDFRTQRVRGNILDDLCRAHGDKPAVRMEPRHVRTLRDERSNRPEAANALLKAIRQVFAFGIATNAVVHNPAKEVPYLHNGSQGFHSWTPDEIKAFETCHPIGTMARLAFGLLLYTGQRRSDIVQFGRQHVRNGWLKFTQHKNRNKRPVQLEIPVVDELRRIIDRSPCGDLTFLVTKFGRPFTANGFGNKFREWCNAAGLPQCSAHGLRKATAARLAELRATEHEIMAVTGHRTSKEVARYTQAARQKVLAARAMARLTKVEIANESVPLNSVVQESGTKSTGK